MRNIKINRNIIIASIIIAVIIPVFFYTKYYLTGDNKPIHNILIGISYSFIVSISIFTVNFNIVTWLHRKYLADKIFIQRMSFEILLTNFNAIIIVTTFALLFTLVFNHFGNPDNVIRLGSCNIPLLAVTFLGLASNNLISEDRNC